VRGVARFAIETVLLMLLAGGMLVGAVMATQEIFDDDKIRYFLIGYYVAVHHSLVLWVWKKLRTEKLRRAGNSREQPRSPRITSRDTTTRHE